MSNEEVVSYLRNQLGALQMGIPAEAVLVHTLNLLIRVHDGDPLAESCINTKKLSPRRRNQRGTA